MRSDQIFFLFVCMAEDAMLLLLERFVGNYKAKNCKFSSCRNCENNQKIPGTVLQFNLTHMLNNPASACLASDTKQAKVFAVLSVLQCIHVSRLALMMPGLGAWA